MTMYGPNVPVIVSLFYCLAQLGLGLNFTGYCNVVFLSNLII